MKCERCGMPGFDVQGEVCLCTQCLSEIVRDWKVQHEEFGELAS
jgi:ribosomal protein L37E